MSEHILNYSEDLQIDLSYLNEVAGGSSEFMVEMIDMFLDQTPDYFTQIDQSINEGNWSKVADIAHKIKPTLTFMGVDFAKNDMAEIERKAKNLDSVEEIRPAFNQLKSLSVVLYRKLEEEKLKLQNEG